MAEAIFTRDGELFVPSELARGPWSPEAQHGGPPAALLARAVEQFAGGDEMFVARLTIELLRPVPISPLAVHARFTRPGRKVQLVEATLRTGETEVARCTGLRIRRQALPLPPELRSGSAPPGPESGAHNLPPWKAAAAYRGFHNHGVEHRFVEGSFTRPGPATDWIRLCVPLIEGEETSPVSRVAAAADFGNGVSWIMDRNLGYSFINPDLTIYLHRHPVGEWVCIAAATSVQAYGIGMAESALFDQHGPIGRSVQSLLIEHVAR